MSWDFGCGQNNLVNTAQELYRKSIAIQAEKTNAIAKSIRDDRRDAVLMQGAKANIEQVGLLEKQLEEVKLQNVKLDEANKSLNALYEQAKKDAEENAKIAEKSKLQARISIGISIFAVVVSIVMGILGIVL